MLSLFVIFIICFKKMSTSNKVQSTYPISSACSFLGINYYEEASNKFQEYLSEALIPERCCLLNDVTYPLETIDSFYWAPWKSVEYERDFLSKEADKVDERILKFCNSIPSLYETENIILDEDVLSKSEDLFDDVNFKILNLEKLHEELINGVDNFSFLEVPLIPFHLKKINSSLSGLLENISLMEVEDIFEKEADLAFEDLEATFASDIETNEKDKLFDCEENFEEMVLPMIPDENINCEHLTFDCKKDGFSLKSTNDWSNETSDSKLGKENKNLDDNRNFNTHFHQRPSFLNCQDNRQISHISTPSDEETLYSTINQHSSGKFLIKEKKQTIIADSSTSDSISKLDHNSQFYNEKDTSILNLKTSEENNSNLLDLCSEDFFAEKFLNFESSDDENIDDQSIFNNNSILEIQKLNSKVNDSFVSDLKSTEIQQNGTTKVFLEKLAELDLTKTNEVYDDKVSVTKENPKCTVKRFSSSRDKSLMSEMPSCETSRNETNIAEEVPCKSQNFKSFNLLSSFLYSRKKESCVILSSESSPNYSPINTNSAVEHGKNINNFKNVKEEYPSNSNNNIQEFSKHSVTESIPCLKNEDIMVKLPDDYVEVIQMYETATIYYIQKLLPWEGFQFSSDLTIVDISLDKTRFLLNQEIKNCRDRNIGPLEGGVQYSHYIQLLILHGILKSMNCFIHFGVELSISSLYDFERKHITALKGCFQHLLSEINKFTEKSSITNTVHPKIKDLASYLQSKYFFCKDNGILFKVLIVVKDYLKFFHSSFEAFMKTLLPELSIDLIPESCYLQQQTDIFSGNEDHIYIASLSSLSKDILLKNLSLFIEYEKEDSMQWKTTCNLENVAYSCMKFHLIPLKSLEEINSLPLHKGPFCQTLNESSKMPVIVLSSIYSKYTFLNSLDEAQNVSVHERSYMEYLPHMHFADITVSRLAGIIIISLMSFLDGDFLDSVVDRLLGLHMKYEIIWIIMRDYLLDKNLNEEILTKIGSGYYKFYCITMNMKILQSFKIKFLYAESEEDIIKWINQIISKNLKIALNKQGCYPKKSLSVKISEEELFLISFPSLNPIIVAFILSERISLHDLMNLKLEELCSKFYYIPQRFLKQFHRDIQGAVNYDSNSYAVVKEKNIGRLQMYSENTRHSKTTEFQEQLNSNLEEVKKFINCIEKYKTYNDNFIDDDFDSELTQMSDYPSTPFNNSSDNYSEMTAEEIDRNYRSLQLQDLESATLDVDFGLSSPAGVATSLKLDNNMSPSTSQSNLYSPPPKKRKHSYDDQCVESYGAHQKELQPYSLTAKSCDVSNAYHISKYSQVPSVSSNPHNKNMFVKPDMNANQISKYYQVPNVSSHFKNKNMLAKPDIKLCNTLYCEDESLDSSQTVAKGINLSQYIFKNKRRPLPDSSNCHKSLKLCNQSSLLCSSSRIQKGQSSQTVCKQTWFKNIGETQTFQITESSSQFYQSSGLPQNSASQPYSSDNRIEEFRDPDDVSHIEKVDSFWMSQGSVPLTPKLNHRLSYEKIPGKKGQTRLVFQ